MAKVLGAESTIRKKPVEYLMMNLPGSILSALVLYPILYLVDMNISILWISALPPELRNFFTISICLFLDSLIFFVYVAWAFYHAFIIPSFVMTFTQRIEEALEEIRYLPFSITSLNF